MELSPADIEMVKVHGSLSTAIVTSIEVMLTVI